MKQALQLSAVVCIVSLIALPLHATQQLQAGEWSGMVTPPGGETSEVVFTVAHDEDGLSINIQVLEANMAFDVNDAKLDGDTLSFWFEVPNEISCTLQLDDEGRYAGDCIDQEGDAGYMIMIPPAG